jgi:GT2 family glycosyltransferase
MEELRKRVLKQSFIFRQDLEKNDVSFSVLIPVYKPKPSFFKKALVSVCNQVSSSFEILIGFDGSPSDELVKIVEEIQQNLKTSSEATELRVFYLDRKKEGGGISNTSNELAKEAKNKYLVLMDHDDWLRPDMLLRYEQTLLMSKNREHTVLYCNEFKINEKGEEKINSFLWKPENPPFPYFFVNYVCHCLAIPKKMFFEIGGLRAECDGAQDYDLVLRLDLAGAKFQNCPFFLYAWRAHKDSTASDIDSKSYASSSGVKALSDYVKKKKMNWDVEEGLFPTVYRVKPVLNKKPKIQVVVPFKDNKEMTLRAIDKVLEQEGVDFAITAIDNMSNDKSISRELEKKNIELIYFNEPFNYSRMNNLAVKESKKAKNMDLVLFLNNDVDLEQGALYEMATWAYQAEIGVVGCALFYPDSSIYQHSGLEQIGDSISPYYTINKEFFDKDLIPGNKGFATVLRPVDAVTFACAMMKKDLFTSLGGFDEVFYPIAYSDVDLCRRIKNKGLYCFYTPYARGIHHEGASRGRCVIEDFEMSDWLMKKRAGDIA